MKKLNKRGFTLIELLAALVILTAIMAIAIPSISSSLERTKSKQDDSRKKVLITAAELYVTDHKNAIYNNLGSSDTCYIELSSLDVSASNLEDSDGNELEGVIKFTKPNTYEYVESSNGLTKCI